MFWMSGAGLCRCVQPILYCASPIVAMFVPNTTQTYTDSLAGTAISQVKLGRNYGVSEIKEISAIHPVRARFV
jgi:hypothetical protein